MFLSFPHSLSFQDFLKLYLAPNFYLFSQLPMVCFTKCFCGWSVMDMCNDTIVLFCYNQVARINHHSAIGTKYIPATITFLVSFLKDENARQENPGVLKGKR